jgi:hypothetical protein
VKKESNNCFKTENQYMQDNRDMHKIDEALYFVEEKSSDNGIKYLLAIPIQTFVLPDIGTEIVQLSKRN